MTKKLRLVFLGLSLTVVHTACKKSNTEDTIPMPPPPPPVTLEAMLSCYRTSNWDSVAIQQTLIGEWQWEYIRCYWKPESANNKEFKNLAIEFTQHDSLIVRMNGQLVQKGSWKLTRLNDGYYRLSMNPLVPQLSGKIVLCEGRVLLYDSYVDGCDNYFKKHDWKLAFHGQFNEYDLTNMQRHILWSWPSFTPLCEQKRFMSKNI